MSRRIALACSFALTLVVSFAVASLASQAGWLGAQSEPTEATQEASLPESAPPSPPAAPAEQLEPIVITEYVYEDVQVIVPSREEAEGSS